MQHKATRDKATGEYTYRGYGIYKLNGEWWVRPAGEVCATDVTATLKDAKRIIDTVEGA